MLWQGLAGIGYAGGGSTATGSVTSTAGGRWNSSDLRQSVLGMVLDTPPILAVPRAPLAPRNALPGAYSFQVCGFANPKPGDPNECYQELNTAATVCVDVGFTVRDRGGGISPPPYPDNRMSPGLRGGPWRRAAARSCAFAWVEPRPGCPEASTSFPRMHIRIE